MWLRSVALTDARLGANQLIDLKTMTDGHDNYEQNPFKDGVDDPAVADPRTLVAEPRTVAASSAKWARGGWAWTVRKWCNCTMTAGRCRSFSPS